MTNLLDIKEKSNSLIKYALHYGAILGLFWIFKYLFKIGAGFSDHIFIYVFYLLNVGTFLLIYIFTFKFRDSVPNKPKSTLQCILFVVLVCFFASFFESAIIYAHYKFIDPGYFAKLIEPFLEALDSMKKLGGVSEQDFDRAKDIYRSLLSNIGFYVAVEFIRNIFLGSFLGVFIAFLIKTKKTF